MLKILATIYNTNCGLPQIIFIIPVAATTQTILSVPLEVGWSHGSITLLSVVISGVGAAHLITLHLTCCHCYSIYKVSQAFKYLYSLWQWQTTWLGSWWSTFTFHVPRKWSTGMACSRVIGLPCACSKSWYCSLRSSILVVMPPACHAVPKPLTPWYKSTTGHAKTPYLSSTACIHLLTTWMTRETFQWTCARCVQYCTYCTV